MDQAQIQALIDAAIRASEPNLQQQLAAARNDLVKAQNQIIFNPVLSTFDKQ